MMFRGQRRTEANELRCPVVVIHFQKIVGFRCQFVTVFLGLLFAGFPVKSQDLLSLPSAVEIPPFATALEGVPTVLIRSSDDGAQRIPMTGEKWILMPVGCTLQGKSL